MKQQPITSDLDRPWSTPMQALMVTSRDRDGRPNIVAVAWFMRASMEPPVFAVGLGKKSLSCANITASGEFVIAVPGQNLASELMYCGMHTGSEVDKFAACKLTALDGEHVRAPLIGECLHNLECRIVVAQDVGDHRVFCGEVVAAWSTELDGEPLLIVGERGGYQVVHEEAGFRLGGIRD